MNTISATAFSVRNPVKQKCGDASFAGEITVSGEKAVLLLAADGVSKAPKDWLASATTVQTVVAALQNSELPAKDAFQKAVETAQQTIREGVEETFGMLSTLSAVIFLPATQKVLWHNTGDSRIYGLSGSKWKQLTTDDSTSMPYKENGKLKLKNGVPIMLSALTKAIGAPGLKIEVEETGSRYDALILATDGFYSLPGFEQYANTLLNSADFNHTTAAIQQQIINEITDDASFAFLRLPAQNAIDLRTLIETGQEIPAAQVLSVLETELTQAVITGDNDYVEKLLELMEEKQFFYNKEKMISLLELMIQHQSPLHQKMVSLVRKL